MCPRGAVLWLTSTFLLIPENCSSFTGCGTPPGWAGRGWPWAGRAGSPVCSGRQKAGSSQHQSSVSGQQGKGRWQEDNCIPRGNEGALQVADRFTGLITVQGSVQCLGLSFVVEVPVTINARVNKALVRSCISNIFKCVRKERGARCWQAASGRACWGP